jgi:hypothetical protein
MLGEDEEMEIVHLNSISFLGIPELSGLATAYFLGAYFLGGIL